MEKIIYVVLHYNTDAETEKCIQSIQQLPGVGKIVLVCNGSTNGTDEMLLEKYDGTDLVDVLLNKENVGYAKGLNIGFQYAKKQLLADFIVCMNNDVLIRQRDFNKCLIEQYDKLRFAVAAPDVVNLDGMHCNPGYMDIPTRESVEQALNQYQRRLKGCEMLFGIPEIISCALARVKRMKPKHELQTENRLYRFHGCCWIFSRKFIDKYDGICPKTYLYGEEEILSYMCHIGDMKMSYLPELSLIHAESITTKQIHKDLLVRHAFYYRHLIHSTEVLLDLVVDAERQGSKRFETESPVCNDQ